MDCATDIGSGSDSDAATVATVDHELLHAVEYVRASLTDTLSTVTQIIEQAKSWTAAAAIAAPPKETLKVTLAATNLTESLWPGLPASSSIDFESFIATVTKYTLETLAAGDPPAAELRSRITAHGGWFAFLHSLIAS